MQSEISNENFDHFDEEDPFHPDGESKNKRPSRKLDLNFVGYTYKADVEEQRSQLVNVLKELGNTCGNGPVNNSSSTESNSASQSSSNYSSRQQRGGNPNQQMHQQVQFKQA